MYVPACALTRWQTRSCVPAAAPPCPPPQDNITPQGSRREDDIIIIARSASQRGTRLCLRSSSNIPMGSRRGDKAMIIPGLAPQCGTAFLQQAAPHVVKQAQRLLYRPVPPRAGLSRVSAHRILHLLVRGSQTHRHSLTKPLLSRPPPRRMLAHRRSDSSTGHSPLRVGLSSAHALHICHQPGERTVKLTADESNRIYPIVCEQ